MCKKTRYCVKFTSSVSNFLFKNPPEGFYFDSLEDVRRFAYRNGFNAYTVYSRTEGEEAYRFLADFKEEEF